MIRFCPQTDWPTRLHVRNFYCGAWKIVKCCGGWNVFDYQTDYETWRNQK